MKKSVRHGFFAAGCLLAGLLLFSGRGRAASPVQKWGRLAVKGTDIVNEKGKKVQLKGVSTHGIAWYPQYVNRSCFKSMKKLGVNTIRLALYSNPADGFTTDLYGKVEQGVKYATELGMYVILDWHVLSEGNPKIYQKQAMKFFTRMAKKYAGQKNVLYEICNEPNGDVTWQRDVYPYANKVINRIRQYDGKNIIIVGTPTWSQDVDVVPAKPLKQKNLVYALHFYAATHGEFLREKLKKARESGVPVLVSEFNICDASGSGSLDKASGKKWLRLLKKYKIGHVAWNLSNKDETSALLRSSCQKTGKIKKNDLSESGRWIAGWWRK